jgi:hypothetical protein
MKFHYIRTVIYIFYTLQTAKHTHQKASISNFTLYKEAAFSYVMIVCFIFVSFQVLQSQQYIMTDENSPKPKNQHTYLFIAKIAKKSVLESKHTLSVLVCR